VSSRRDRGRSARRPRGAAEPRQPDPDARRAILEEEPAAEAERWAAAWRDDLHRQGRLATGGWPGTIAEARARVTVRLDLELRRRNLGALTYEERQRATRAMYASARRNWLAQVVRSAEDDGSASTPGVEPAP
jgi:hypothetical protein